ncbi:hypothetical protein [Streptomyces scopuliridis]|uniref:hypothetical protein n=1 Tax=Streptomyces scopuliridis TaxID=452529 RepID=UPI0036C1D8F9
MPPLALPNTLAVATVVVATQTPVEVLGLVTYVRLVPAGPAGRARAAPAEGPARPLTAGQAPDDKLTSPRARKASTSSAGLSSGSCVVASSSASGSHVGSATS